MELHATGRGLEVTEIAPTRCPAGHPLRWPNVQVSHLPCSCAGEGGHRVYRCWTCEAVLYFPPHDAAMVPAYGRWDV